LTDKRHNVIINPYSIRDLLSVGSVSVLHSVQRPSGFWALFHVQSWKNKYQIAISATKHMSRLAHVLFYIYSCLQEAGQKFSREEGTIGQTNETESIRAILKINNNQRSETRQDNHVGRRSERQIE